MTTSDFGFLAENIVAEHLQGKGYAIIDRNWRRKWGELDIVAKRDEVVVFVEVKANREEVSGFAPQLRANQDKLRKVARTARTWLAYRKYSPDQEWQIDVVSVIFDKINKKAKITHFKNVEI